MCTLTCLSFPGAPDLTTGRIPKPKPRAHLEDSPAEKEVG